jgi:hypothetical protein
MRRPLTRRQFIKRTAGVGVLAIGATGAFAGGKALLEKLSSANKIKARERVRPRDENHWFGPDERPSIRALADLIIPQDQDGPGGGEPEVIERLDRLVATSSDRQRLYASGLVGFDELALQQGADTFAALPPDAQLQTVALVERIYESTSSGGYSLFEIAQRNVIEAYHTWPAPGGWQGFSEAFQLWPQLIADVKDSFYTSNVAWQWLAYEGPPFPRGYFGRVAECAAKKGRGNG